MLNCNCNREPSPEITRRVEKPFCVRLDWPGKTSVAYTMTREDVAHCLMHEPDMAKASDQFLWDDLARMMGEPESELDHSMIIQILFYLCVRQPVYKAADGVPTVDFCWVKYPERKFLFGRQEPGPENVRWIRSVHGHRQDLMRFGIVA